MPFDYLLPCGVVPPQQGITEKKKSVRFRRPLHSDEICILMKIEANSFNSYLSCRKIRRSGNEILADVVCFYKRAQDKARVFIVELKGDVETSHGRNQLLNTRQIFQEIFTEIGVSGVKIELCMVTPSGSPSSVGNGIRMFGGELDLATLVDK